MDSFRNLHQQIFAFKVFCMEKRLSDIFKTINVSKLTKTILESSYGKSLKQFVYFLRVVVFCWTLTTFWKVAKLHFLKISQKSHRNLSRQAKVSMEPIGSNGSNDLAAFVFFRRRFFQNKSYLHFEFSINKYLGKVLSYLKNYGPSRLRLHWISSR